MIYIKLLYLTGILYLLDDKHEHGDSKIRLAYSNLKIHTRDV